MLKGSFTYVHSPFDTSGILVKFVVTTFVFNFIASIIGIPKPSKVLGNKNKFEYLINVFFSLSSIKPVKIQFSCKLLSFMYLMSVDSSLPYMPEIINFLGVLLSLFSFMNFINLSNVIRFLCLCNEDIV